MSELAKKIIEQFKADVKGFVVGEVFSKGAITGVLSKACGGDSNRYLILKVLTGKTSSKFLDEAEWYALLKMVQPYKPEGGHWMSKREEELRLACGALLTFQADQQGQAKMFENEK